MCRLQCRWTNHYVAVVVVMVMLVLVLVLVVLLLASSFFFPHVQDLQPEAPVHELTCDL